MPLTGLRRLGRRSAMLSVLCLTLSLAFLATPLAAEAEPVVRIGLLGDASWEPLRQGLRELSYVEGQNIAIEYRPAEGRRERLPDLAAELVRLKVDVIVTYGTPGTLAAKQATTTIPSGPGSSIASRGRAGTLRGRPS